METKLLFDLSYGDEFTLRNRPNERYVFHAPMRTNCKIIRVSDSSKRKGNGNMTVVLTGHKNYDIFNTMNEKIDTAIDNVNSMKYGDKFLGNDNKVYTFTGTNRTRFKMEDARGNQYTARPGFIKEVL